MNAGLVNVVVAATAGILGGCASAFITAQLKIRELERASEIARRSQENEERARRQLQYLNPLRVQTEDLRRRLIDVDRRVNSADSFLPDTVKEIARMVNGPFDDYAHWPTGSDSMPCRPYM